MAANGRPRALVTRRELQVAQLAADGLQNGDIAEHLGCKEQTVRHHTRNLCGKIGAKNRTHMVAILFRMEVLK